MRKKFQRPALKILSVCALISTGSFTAGEIRRTGLQRFLGMPFREDGVLNHQGIFTTFMHPGISFVDPGLNCSGFVLAAFREITHRSELTIPEATKDRNGNSGPGAEFGHDWDFGLDLILNLSEGFPREVIVPGEAVVSIARLPESPEVQLGFNLHSPDDWNLVLKKFEPQKVYLAVINKPARKKGYRLIYYHVAIILREDPGHIWFYHSTRQNGVHRLNLLDPHDMSRFHRQFARSPWGDKYIFILSLLPGSEQAAGQAHGILPISGLNTP